MTKKRSRLMAASKLSDYQIKRIIRCYAEGVSATETSQRVRVSYVSISKIYHLIRQRLLALSVYTSVEKTIEIMDARDDVQGYWDEREFRDYLERQLGLRRGVTARTREFHEAELVHRFIEDELSEHDAAAAHYAEIVKLVRLSGPLNRHPRDQDMLRALMYAWERSQDTVRRINREIPVLQRQIESEARRRKR